LNGILLNPEPPAESILAPGVNTCAVARAERLSLLIDGEAYFSAFRRAAEAAERSIIVVAWDFDSGTQLDPASQHPVLLGDFLNRLVKRRRKLHVHVLNWDYPMIFGADRELSPLYGLTWRPHRRVHFRYDDTHPLAGSQHQKIVVIDDKLAFIGGTDLACRRWDTPEHRPNDPRRTASGKPYPPFHDVMAAVDGEAARVLAGLVRARWKRATGEGLPVITTRGDPWPRGLQPDLTGVCVGVACTEPETDGRPGVRQVERLYLDMIARARRSIYIENQYFTSNAVGSALAARLSEPDGPEIVLVTRLLSHGWLEEMTMHVLRTRLIRQLRAADRNGRFQVYYPHIDGLAEGTCVDVHSKLMIVDDAWLRIGSANISNRSMGLDAECDLLIEARGENRVMETIRNFRDSLLAEHLASTPSQVRLAIGQRGGLIEAIAALQSPPRTLRVLNDLKQWPEAVVDAVAITDPEKPVSVERLLSEFAPSMEQGHPPRLIRNVLLAGTFLALMALAWRFTPLGDWISADKVTAWAEAFGSLWWAPLVVIAAYTPASIVLFPRPLITLAATVAFGPALAFACGFLGMMIAGVATYAMGRVLDRDRVRRIAGERLHRLGHVLRQRGLPAVIAVRFVPIAPYWVVNMVAGAIRIRLWHFLVGTALGVLPGLLAATVYGDQLGAALKDPARINYWLVGAITLFFAAAIVIVRAWLLILERAQMKRESESTSSSVDPDVAGSNTARASGTGRIQRCEGKNLESLAKEH